MRTMRIEHATGNRRAVRRAGNAPLIHRAHEPLIVPSTPLHPPLGYLDRNWPIVMGCKYRLFSDTAHGAQLRANLYSLIGTAKAIGLEPCKHYTAY